MNPLEQVVDRLRQRGIRETFPDWPAALPRDEAGMCYLAAQLDALDPQLAEVMAQMAALDDGDEVWAVSVLEEDGTAQALKGLAAVFARMMDTVRTLGALARDLSIEQSAAAQVSAYAEAMYAHYLDEAEMGVLGVWEPVEPFAQTLEAQHIREALADEMQRATPSAPRRSSSSLLPFLIGVGLGAWLFGGEEDA